MGKIRLFPLLFYVAADSDTSLPCSDPNIRKYKVLFYASFSRQSYVAFGFDTLARIVDCRFTLYPLFANFHCDCVDKFLEMSPTLLYHSCWVFIFAKFLDKTSRRPQSGGGSGIKTIISRRLSIWAVNGTSRHFTMLEEVPYPLLGSWVDGKLGCLSSSRRLFTTVSKCLYVSVV